MKGAGEAGPRTGDSIVWISAQCARNRTVNRTRGRRFAEEKPLPEGTKNQHDRLERI